MLCCLQKFIHKVLAVAVNMVKMQKSYNFSIADVLLGTVGF